MLYRHVRHPNRLRRLASIRGFIWSLTVLSLYVPSAPAWAEDVPPAIDSDLLSAQQKAVSSGDAVRVDALTTEITEVVANADGTFTNSTSLMPVRIRKSGNWVPVDATLRQNDDGSWSPAASPHGIALSGGGTGPVVRLTHADGSRLGFTMPFPLPSPTVSGDTALYASVLPGVDLSVSVTDQGGFSDVLVVHDAAAAADPRVKELRLAVSTEGLQLAPTESGGMEAKAGDGTLDYVSPRPLMWDSATSGASAATSLRQAFATVSEGPVPAPTSVSSVDGPGEGALVDEVPMSTSASAVTLRPDPAVLDGPDTVYPVYIDPYTNPVSSKSGHFTEVYSSSQCADSPQYDKPQTNGEGAGYQRWGGACGVGLERSYYAINTSGLAPEMVVSKAIISVPSTYAASWDCSKDQPITLHTTASINSSTDWNSKPATVDGTYPPVTTTIPSAANPNSSCSNSTASFTVTNQTQKIADAGLDWWTIGLFGDETISSSNDNYLRLSTVVTLITTFDIPPNTPTNLRTTPSAAAASGPCVTSGVGWVGATSYSDAGSNLQLHSTLTTNVSGELARAHYNFWDRSFLTNGNPTTVATPVSTYVASGTDAAVPVGVTLKDGHEYGWNVYAEDNAAVHLKSAVSAHCWFRTDFSPPETPDITSNPSFPQVGNGAGDPVIYAGPGKTTTFDVSAIDNAPPATCTPGPCLTSGIDHFLWRLDAQPTAQVGISAPVSGTNGAGASTATLQIPVTAWGVHTLYVAAVDKAGNLSQTPVGYTYTVPWNPDTKVTPGDIGGDGIPDLLATTRTGDLIHIPGNKDAAQPVAPAPSSPPFDPTSPATGPAIVATGAHTPDGSGWYNYLVAHRGSLHSTNVDDLFAYNKQTHQLYVVKNDLVPKADNGGTFSTYGGFIGKRFDVITKGDCEDEGWIPDSTRCRTASYNSTTWNIEQLVTPGNLYKNPANYPAVITVEDKKLWIYATDGGAHLKHPILLGDGDWSGFTLIAPGTVGATLTTIDGIPTVTGGTAALWARDDVSGSLYTFSITVDQNDVPTLLHAPVRTAFPSAVAVSGGGKICMDVAGAQTVNGTNVQVYACNGTRAQSWTLMADKTIRALGGCLDVNGNGSANGTQVQLWTCNGSSAQKWELGTSGSLVHTGSGKCLDDPNASTTNSTQLQLYTCNGTAAQNWASGAAPGWKDYPPTPMAPVLSKAQFPTVMSPGDLNSLAGGPDLNPELYAVDSSGQLVEFAGLPPQNSVPAFAAAASLGAVTNTATHGWHLNEGTGTLASDSPGTLTAGLTGAYSWVADSARGNVLKLSGTTGYATTSGPAVNTAGSYSVSAWVKLSSLTANSTFVSQSDSGGNANGFQLYYSSGAKAWAFGRHHDGSAGPSFSAAYGTTAVADRWTHLVGVFDASTNQLLLYVDGRLAGARTYAGTSWSADGGMQIGRRLYQGTYGEYANGSVSDIRIYPTALPASNAAVTREMPGVTQLD
ncbi:ricin-type beta-trefoil lectin domain protein [Streptomyces sp. NPDC101158]|uniref:ricin-type beta-trefoil lectin domain protein n=1 Tax=Streptomyces sp. NPDC101158 TaxID=3366117 RepID=UPI00380FBD00